MILSKLTLYCSHQTHFAINKSCKILGIPSINLRRIECNELNNFKLSPLLLDEQINNDINNGYIHFFVVLILVQPRPV